MTEERKYHIEHPDEEYQSHKGNKIRGRIVHIRGYCPYGHKVGDEFEISGESTGGLCGYLYYNIYPYMLILQFGGKFPETGAWGGERVELFCPDPINAVRIQLRREGVTRARHPVYLKDEEDEEKWWREKFGKA